MVVKQACHPSGHEGVWAEVESVECVPSKWGDELDEIPGGIQLRSLLSKVRISVWLGRLGYGRVLRCGRLCVVTNGVPGVESDSPLCVFEA